MLAETTPASFVAFDLLALGDESLMDEPFSVRRAQLEKALEPAKAPIHVTRTTTDAEEAEEWFGTFEGAGLDGIVAKALAKPYAPNGRTMLKIKHARTADVVVAGYRLHKTSTDARPLLGSMLLGLYADDGNLQHVGVAASFTEAQAGRADRRAGSADRDRPVGPPVGSVAGSRALTPTRGCPAARVAGAAARTCRSYPCGPSGSSRSATSTWRATGSGTPRSSSAGAPIVSRSRAATPSSKRSRSTTSRTCSPDSVVTELAQLRHELLVG